MVSGYINLSDLTIYNLQNLMDILQIVSIIANMAGLKNLIDHLDITILNIEYYSVGKEWNYQKISNPYSRIYYITDGYGEIYLRGRKYELVAGNMYLIPCYTIIDMHCPDSFSHYYVHFISRLQSGLDILSIVECEYQAEAGLYSIDSAVFDRLLKLNPDKELLEYDAKKPIYKQVLDRAVRQDQDKSTSNLLEANALIRLLLAAFFKDQSSPQVQNTLHGLSRFDNVLEYIQHHLDEPITVAKLAKMANLNPTYFCNLFSNFIGVPPLQYINRRRIEKAQELLLGTDETLYEISYQIGFNDEYYFSRLFKKYVGLSPNHYRKQQQILHKR